MTGAEESFSTLKAVSTDGSTDDCSAVGLSAGLVIIDTGYTLVVDSGVLGGVTFTAMLETSVAERSTSLSCG